MKKKVRLATIWLDGCSGCHMSFLDIDEALLAVADQIDLVYGPLVDVKEFPENVDVTLVEGAVSSEEDLHKIKTVRQRSRIVVALGDCAVTSNVPSMRNSYKVHTLFDRAYIENASAQQQHPTEGVPSLLPKARPLHEYVKVDVHVPGCPPSADLILSALGNLLVGEIPELTNVRFG